MAGWSRNAEHQRTSTAFPITLTLLSSIYNLIIAISCAFLPDDPLYIGLSISLYAWAGSILSILGLIGIVTNRPTLLHPYTHFLLLDTFVSALIRLLILQLLLETFPSDICPLDEPTWSPRNFHHDIVTSVRWQKQSLWQATRRSEKCRIAVEAVQLVLVGLLVCLTAAQGCLAVAMRRFAGEMEKRPVDVEASVREEVVTVRDPEKAILEERGY